MFGHDIPSLVSSVCPIDDSYDMLYVSAIYRLLPVFFFQFFPVLLFPRFVTFTTKPTSSASIRAILFTWAFHNFPSKNSFDSSLDKIPLVCFLGSSFMNSGHCLMWYVVCNVWLFVPHGMYFTSSASHPSTGFSARLQLHPPQAF